MTKNRPQAIWKAETCLTGGYLCNHNHRSREAAEKCLPKIPDSVSGSLTTYFSLANVVAMNEEAKEIDENYSLQ